jgi:sulfopyruvate decarboxylase TPP-binding subunit
MTAALDHNSEVNWQEDVFRVLKEHDVKHVVYVPDAGHSTAIRLAEEDTEIHSVVLTTEEEGIGYLAGAWLGRSARGFRC